MTVPSATDTSTSTAICPFCTGNATRNHGVAVDESGSRFPLKQCGDCGTGFLSPPPSDAELTRAYATSYYGEGDTKFGGAIERLRDFAAAGRARNLVRGLPGRARALDVGCGDGRFLRWLGKQHAGLELHGIELPGPAAERAARVPGLVLHSGTLNTTNFEDASFDVISLVHVIEHLPDPAAALDRLVRWLRPGGRLFLAFPNFESWQATWFGTDWFHLDPPRHLTLVPPRSVIRRMQTSGLKLIHQRHWCPEQNLFGWIQSALNACDRHRNFLYERLKRNRGYHAERTIAPAVHLAAAAALTIPSLLLDAAAAAFRSGATVELTFQKSPSDHVS
ncbi:MAG: class I SAM-dependent methyltransferase [Opitutaceae bacterium]